MADTAHNNLVEIIRQAENEYHHDLTDRALEDYIAEAILNSGYVPTKHDGLPEIRFDGKKLFYNGIDISRGAGEVRTALSPNCIPTATITFACSNIDLCTVKEAVYAP